MRKLATVVLSFIFAFTALPVCTLAEESRAETESWLKLPYVYAPGYDVAPTVNVFGSGVTNGTLVKGEVVDTVIYDDGAEADLLTDGYHATFSESKHMAVCGVGDNGDNRVQLGAKASASNNTGKMIKFTEEESGVDVLFSGDAEVSSLHIWAWPSNAIDCYEVLMQNGGEWETIAEGSLMDERNASVQTDCSTFYSIRFDRNYCTSALRFVIKSFGENADTDGVHLVEVVPRPTNEINLTAVNPMRALNTPLDKTSVTSYPIYFDTYVVAGYGWNPTDVESGKNGLTGNCRRAGIWNNSNLFGKNKFGNTSGEYYPVEYPAYDTRIINPANKETTPKNAYYAVASLGGTQQVNRISFLTSAINGLKGMELFCTDDATVWDSLSTKGIYRDAELDSRWTKLLSVKGNFANNTVYTYDIADAPTAKYWAVRYLCDVHTVVQNTAMYSLREDEISSYAVAVNDVIERVFDGAVATDSLNLPSEVLDANGNSISLEWSCDASFVDLSTGIITPPQDDASISLTASISLDNRNYSLTKAISVLGQDNRQKTILIDEPFNTIEAFSEISGNVRAQNGAAVLENQAKAKLSLQPGYGFLFDGKRTLELDLASMTTGGEIEFYDGSTKLAGIVIEDGKIRAEYKNGIYEQTLYNDMKLDFSDKSFNLYLDEGNGDIVRVYEGEFFTTGVVDTVKLVGRAGETLAVDSAKLSVVGEELFRQVEQQFDLKKINPSGGSNITENLNLISSLGDITFTYDSSAPTIVNPVTGAVDVSTPGQVMFDVFATAPSGSFTKRFTAAISGLSNVAASSTVTVNTTGSTGYDATFSNDDNLDTEFRSSENNGWKLTLDFKEKKALNYVSLYEADTNGKINGFTISLSNDGNTYTNVYTGTEIVSGALIPIPVQFARYIRITVTSITQPSTGLKEVYVFLKQTDMEKLQYDLNEMVNGLEIKQDVLIPKTGIFGSNVSITTNSSLVTVIEEGDYWKINTHTPTTETIVEVTLNLHNGSETLQKVYQVVLLADSNIRDNKPIIGGGSHGGGSGGGTSGGRGGVSFVPMPQAESGLKDSAYSSFEQELTGHWGKNEIMALVKTNIVSGDGTGLQLNKTVTRAEFLKMLLEVCKLQKLEYSGGFSDVDADAWYADYVQTAKHYGIMSGDGTNFRGEEPITRQEMAVTLVNALRVLQIVIPEGTTESFSDREDIAIWAAESVGIAAEMQLLKGYETGNFLPKNNLFRDEAMVVVYRVLANVIQ